jgi:magnesium-transporting ATPase (P-type)
MRRPPRQPDAPVLNPFVITRTVLVAILMAAGALGLFLIEYAAISRFDAESPGYAQAQTEAVTTVIFFQMFYLLHCRSFKEPVLKTGLYSNPWIYVGIAAVLLLQVGFVYLPFMHDVFGSAPLSLASWAQAAVVGLLIVPIISMEKWWRRRRADHTEAATSAPTG